MPRPFLHATMPGPAQATGFVGGLLRLVLTVVFFVFAFFILLFTLTVGLIFVLLSALGLGPKRSMPKAPFGFPFQPPQDAESVRSTAKPSSQAGDTPKELESFHGSLDEFMQQRKNQTP